MIDPKYVMMQTLLADRLFRIPPYQRFYSWKQRQRHDLFADLERLASRKDAQPHFLSTVVCHRTAETYSIGTTQFRVYDVVDGQQRLTTLILLLKCIELHLNPDTEEARDLVKLLVKRDGQLLLVQSNHANHSLFADFLRTGSRPQATDLRTPADFRLVSAINDCSTFVQKWQKEQALPALMALILHRLGLVIYDTDDSRSVCWIFEVLNSRGLPADWLDKTRSLLIGRAFELSVSQETPTANSLILELQNHWIAIYNLIGKADIPADEILRITTTLHFGTGLAKPPTSEDSLDLLRAACDAPDKPAFIAERLCAVAQHLATLHSNPHLGPGTEILHARILAVALLSTPALTDSERQIALEQWERVTFRIFSLCGKDSRTKIGDFVRLAARIVASDSDHRTFAQILAALRSLGSDYPIDRAVAECLIGNDCLTYSPEICRSVLWAYELHLAQDAGVPVDEQLQSAIWSRRAADVVHPVFPLLPGDDPAWNGKLCLASGAEQAPEVHAGRIGNLVLFPDPNGSKDRGGSFVLKKLRFAQVPLRQLQEVCALPDWDLTQIKEREARIVAFARQRWGDFHAG